MVSQNETAATDPQVPALGAEVESDSTDQEDENLPDPDINLGNVSAAARAAALNADLLAIKRATGHIPGLQSRLDAVERTFKQVESLQATNKQLASRLDSLVTALSDASLITPGAAQGLLSERSDSNSELLTKLSELEERLTRGADPEPEPDTDPRVAAYNAQLAAADEAVFAYAKTKGYEGEIPDAVFQRALAASPNDINAAALEVARWIDREVAAVARRADRKDAASGGTGERSVRKGAVTRAQLENMSIAEVMAIPKEERDRIAAGG